MVDLYTEYLFQKQFLIRNGMDFAILTGVVITLVGFLVFEVVRAIRDNVRWDTQKALASKPRKRRKK